MRVGIDVRATTDPWHTGVSEYTTGFLRAVFAADKKNTYQLFHNAWKPSRRKVPFMNTNSVQIKTLRWPNKLLNSSMRFLKRPCIDQVLGGVDVFFSPNIHTLTLSKGVRRILTFHDLSFLFFPEFYTAKRRLWHRFVNPKKQAREADHIIVPSQNSKADVCHAFSVDPAKVHVLMPGVPEDISAPYSNDRVKEVRETYQLPDQYILFFGTLEPRKNVDGLILAFQKLPEKLKQRFPLIIAGAPGWKTKELKPLLNTKYVHYLGYIPKDDKPYLYRSASLFVFPSFYEGFGFPVLEAMTAGVPVITSDRSSLPEVIADAGLLVNPLNTADITHAMQEFLEDEQLRQHYAQAGKRRAENFSWKPAVDTFLSLLTSR